MQTEEKGVREVSGKPRGRSGKPKQDFDRRVENVKGPLLRQNGMSVTWAPREQPFGHELGFWEHNYRLRSFSFLFFFLLCLMKMSCVLNRKTQTRRNWAFYIHLRFYKAKRGDFHHRDSTSEKQPISLFVATRGGKFTPLGRNMREYRARDVSA